MWKERIVIFQMRDGSVLLLGDVLFEGREVLNTIFAFDYVLVSRVGHFPFDLPI